jgi:cytochrome P450
VALREVRAEAVLNSTGLVLLRPGSHLDKAQIAVAVQRLLERLLDLTLSDAAGTAPTGTVMRGPRTLPVRWRT